MAGRNNQRYPGCDFAAETAARVFAYKYDFRRVDIKPPGDGWHCLHGALSSGADVHFAILPVRHRSPRIEHLMAGIGCDEGFVENERGGLEARVEAAVRPFARRLAHRQLTVLRIREICLSPLEFPNSGRGTW